MAGISCTLEELGLNVEMNNVDTRYGVWNVVSNTHIIRNLINNYDFIVLDLEHGYREFNDIQVQVRQIIESGRELYVRVRNSYDPLTQSLLDLGVSRFLVPQIRTLEEVQYFVSKVTYPPSGQRGFHPKVKIYYSKYELSGAPIEMDVEVFPLIETAESLDIVEEILSIDSVSGVYFGDYDLSLEIANGERNHDKILKVRELVINLSQLKGKKFLSLADSPEKIKELTSLKVSHMILGIDSEIISQSIEKNARQ